MKKHGFRSIFSLLLAVMMVCSMLPTAAFAEGDVEEQPVVVETYTVTYADGMGGAAFPEQKKEGLLYGDPTPAFAGEPALDGYTFTGWDQEIAGTVTQSVTYTAQWQKVQQEAQSDVQQEADGNGETDMQNGPDGRPLLNPDGGYGAENGNVVYKVGPQAAGTITIEVRVFDGKQGYLVGYDTAKKANRGVQSEAYVIPELTKFVESGKFGKVTGVYGSWYWPHTTNLAVGTTIYWSNNSSTGTMTYYVDWYNPNGGGDNPTPPTHYLWNFTLHYDANGGTGAPADQTYGSNDKYYKSHTFDIPSTVPIREGYTFKGWSDTKGGSATRQPGGTCLVGQTVSGYNGGSVTKTLYAVWEKKAPNGPTNGEVTNLLGQVKVHCTTLIAGHEDQTYGLHYALSFMDMLPDGSGYTCNVRVEADEYVTKYNGNYPGTDHVLAGGENRIRSFVLRNDNDGKGWYISEGENLLPIVFNVKCEAPTPPSVPNDKEIERALSGRVNVVVSCVTANSGHPSMKYPLFAYVSGLTRPNPNEVTANSDGTYSYTVSFLASNFVKMYSGAAPFGIGSDHELADAQDLRTVTLTLRDSTVGWTATTQDIKVSAKCEEQQPEETYTVTYTDGVEDEEVFKNEVYPNLKADDPTPKFNNGVDPTRDGFTFQGWEPEVAQNVTGNATYTAKWKKDPAPPTESAVMDALRGAVKITCTTPNSGHDPKIYDLMSGFTPGTVQGDASTGYTYTISVDAGSYVWRYNDEREGTGVVHTLDDISPKPITLKWDDGAWVAETELPINFNVKCKTEEPPVDIKKPTFDELKALLSVKVECTNGSATHETKSDLYALKNNDEDSKFAIGEVNQSGDVPTCTVTIGSKPYVAAFDNTTGKTHEQADTTQTVDLVYSKETRKWALKNANDAPVVFRVACTTEEPSKPYKPKAEDLLSVVIHCKSDVHNDGLYDLTDGIFTVGEVEGNEADGYTCKVTVEAAQYVNKYVGEMKVNHDIVGEGTKTVTLRYESALERWIVDSTVVTFDVECIPAPNISMLQVQVHCVTPNSSHMDESYDLPEDTTLEYVEANTRKITVQAAPYVEQYGNGHELADGESESKTITATWDGVKWNFDATSVTFNVKCTTQEGPAAPTAEQVASLLKVKVSCANSSAAHQKDVPAFVYQPLLTGSFDIGGVTGSAESGYACRITVRAARYVQDFNTRSNATHTPTDGEEKPVTLYYEDGGWTVGTGSGLVEFTVICENVPAQKYTVTYTDGVDGVEIFKDQVYADLTAGTATPKFNGTPTRVGYFFAGWNPAVTATVTGNVTYTATWKVDSNNNGKPDDEEERYTVTYLDGANGRAFASQVYPGLLSGTATPKFNGTPARSGYVFIGWSPVWSGTVTGNVTYTATWSTITGGLDKVPKTGDNGLTLALSALLLFSFCGAAACVVSTKKRG